MPQKAEIRVVLRQDDQYATAFFATLKGEDLYYGPRLRIGDETFRASYHASGKQHLRTPMGRKINEPLTRPRDLKGKKKLGASSGNPTMLQWGYKPKPDTATRRTVILDNAQLRYPSWTVDLWAIEAGRDDLVAEALRDYENCGVVVASVRADWPQPQLLAVVWTLTPEGWIALERSSQRLGSELSSTGPL